MMRGAILAFVLGICYLQQMPNLPGLPWLPVLLAPLVFHRVLIGHYRPLLIFLRRLSLLTLCAGLGFFWAAVLAQYRLADQLEPQWEGRDIQLVGVVATMPQLSARGERIVLDVEQIETPGAHVPRRISLNRYAAGFRAPGAAPVVSRFRAGERWRLTVRLKRPHGTYNPHGFDFELWALERGIRAGGYIRDNSSNARLDPLVYRPAYLIESMREAVRARFQTVLAGERYAAVLQALAIGDGDAIANADWEIFRRTGVVHLMSISGLHVTMVAGLVLALVYACWRRIERLALRIPARKAAAVAGLAAAGVYSLIAGFAVPTQRTFYMLAVLAAALWSGRTVAMSLVLCWALLVVVVIDPWAGLAPGFWLSFGAVALLAYAGSHRLERLRWWREAAHSQWVVTLGLTPLLLALFQQVSLVSPLANAFAIPVISLVVTPLTLLGAVIPLDAILHAAHAVMAWCMWLLQACADLPVALWQQHAPPGWTVLLALAGILWILLPRGFPMRWAGGVALAPMFLLPPSQPLTGELRVTVLDVGQGLAVVLQTASHTLLYDTGPRYSEDTDSGDRIILPYLRGAGIHRLDGMFLTHDDIDHTGGAASVAQGLDVAWMASPLPRNHPLAGIVQPQIRCFAGQSWNWDGVKFEMLHPTFESYQIKRMKDNLRSCVLKVSSRYGSILLTGDIERASEAELLERAGDSLAADVLVVPHHGSKTSSTSPFIDRIAPAAAVFTVGYRNRFGHPKAQVVERYRAAGSSIYRSDKDGAVLFDFSAAGISARTWRDAEPRYWNGGVAGAAEK